MVQRRPQSRRRRDTSSCGAAPKGNAAAGRDTNFEEETQDNNKDCTRGERGGEEKSEGVGECGVEVGAHDGGDADHDRQDDDEGPGLSSTREEMPCTPPSMMKAIA